MKSFFLLFAALSAGFAVGKLEVAPSADPVRKKAFSPSHHAPARPERHSSPPPEASAQLSILTNQLPTAANLALRKDLLKNLAENDPKTFLSLVRDRVVGKEEESLLKTAVAILTETDPDQTADLINALPDGWQKAAAWDQMAVSLGRSENPLEGWKMAERAGIMASAFRVALAREWASTAPVEAFDALFDQCTPWERNRLFFHHSTIAADWMKRNPEEMISWVRRSGFSKPIQDSLLFFGAHATAESFHELSPNDQAALTDLMADPRMQRIIQVRELSELAKTDPGAAMDQALSETHFGAHGLHSATKAVLEEVRKTDPEQALTLSLKTPGTQIRRRFHQDHAARLAEADPESAWTWATEEIHDFNARRGAIEGIMGEWSAKNFAPAANALAQLEPGQMEENTLRRVLWSFAETNHLEAANQEALGNLWHSIPKARQENLKEGLRNVLGSQLPETIANSLNE
ncbi:MAG: hypothetical protein AAF514_09995 [Verrucomicrobiota bacterium]